MGIVLTICAAVLILPAAASADGYSAEELLHNAPYSLLSPANDELNSAEATAIYSSELGHETVVYSFTSPGEEEELSGEFIKNYLYITGPDKNLWPEEAEPADRAYEDFVSVAKSQRGNLGGAPSWSWYGCGYYGPWCACFASWCADQCGYIESGIIPKFSYCSAGAEWFQEKGQWLDGDEIPTPGMLIFFDWGEDGSADHVGIVEKVSGDYVYAIEGNYSNVCSEAVYPIGSYEIMGYGCPQF